MRGGGLPDGGAAEDAARALGRALALARRTGTATADPGAGFLDDPAALQAEAVLATGETLRGFVLAATTARTARALACPEPVAAPLLAASLLATSLLADGAALRSSRAVLGVGAQYLMVIGRSFPREDEIRPGQRVEGDFGALGRVGLGAGHAIVPIWFIPHPRPHPEVPRSGLEGGFQRPQRLLEPSFEARFAHTSG